MISVIAPKGGGGIPSPTEGRGGGNSKIVVLDNGSIL